MDSPAQWTARKFWIAASLAHALRPCPRYRIQGVVRPVEGTILTVAKDVASAAEAALADTNDPYEVLDAVVAACRPIRAAHP